MNDWCHEDTSLQSIIDQLQLPIDSLPWLLPVGHITYYARLEEILQEAILVPQKCDVFKKELLYLSYGKISHRPQDDISSNLGNLPVAFLFSHNLLSQVNHYYPYDTGAAAAGKYGDTWSNQLTKWTRYGVHDNGDIQAACKLVYSFYQGNRQYLDGNIKSISYPSSSNPLEEIHEFLKVDLTPEGVDHRQYSIECQTESTVDLTQYLIWVGVPKVYEQHFRKLWRNNRTENGQPNTPKIEPYNHHRISEPKGIAYLLQEKARDFIEDYLQMDESN
jgi:hypothetical protein